MVPSGRLAGEATGADGCFIVTPDDGGASLAEADCQR
jgi:hypothetical protein